MARHGPLKAVLTVAGSDPSGGAGAQMDLKCFAAAGVHGCSAVTAITVQNTRGVRSVTAVSPDVVRAQLEAIFDDFDISSMKTGMLHNAPTVRVVARKAAEQGVPLIVDPVLSASLGAPLSQPGIVEELRRSLMPKALLVTPNIPEAERIAWMKIRGFDDMERACQKIKSFGCKSVLLKGGHLGKRGANDLFYDGRFIMFRGPRLAQKVHGTGCMLSAFTTAFVGKGFPLVEALGMAKKSVTGAIRCSLHVGGGMRIGDPLRVLRDCSHRSPGK